MTTRFNALRRKHGNSIPYAIEGMLIEVTEQIARLLEARRMSRADLARALGCSNAYITKLLAGNQNLTLESLVRLATSLKTRLEVQLIPVKPNISHSRKF